MIYCHKHGQGLATGRCVTCDDELISLGIQADKDKIKELERLLKDCADELSLNIAYCKNAPTIKNRNMMCYWLDNTEIGHYLQSHINDDGNLTKEQSFACSEASCIILELRREVFKLRNQVFELENA